MQETLSESTSLKLPRVPKVTFRVEAAITRRSPHRSVREDFHSYGSSVSIRTRLLCQRKENQSSHYTPWRLPMLPLDTLTDATVTPVFGHDVPQMFHANERKTRRHLPYSGSLGSHFPTYKSANIHSLLPLLHQSLFKSASISVSVSRFADSTVL